eukprot:8853888-Ditylum_brightwellii.AAC.1
MQIDNLRRQLIVKEKESAIAQKSFNLKNSSEDEFNKLKEEKVMSEKFLSEQVSQLEAELSKVKLTLGAVLADSLKDTSKREVDLNTRYDQSSEEDCDSTEEIDAFEMQKQLIEKKFHELKAKKTARERSLVDQISRLQSELEQ